MDPRSSEQAKQILTIEVEAIQALVQQIDAHLDAVIDTLFNCRGHILVAGAGTSSAVAQRFARLLSCSGTPALYISAAHSVHGGAGAIRPDDVVFAISKGGQTKEINQLVEIARKRGAKIVAQTEKPNSRLGQMADVIYPVRAIGDVDPYGMIATGSSLVNSAAGDILCVLLLEKRGYSQEEFGLTHPEGAVGKNYVDGSSRFFTKQFRLFNLWAIRQPDE
jgi:arabinose-5-phosphate isomerase